VPETTLLRSISWKREVFCLRQPRIQHQRPPLKKASFEQSVPRPRASATTLCHANKFSCVLLRQRSLARDMVGIFSSLSWVLYTLEGEPARLYLLRTFPVGLVCTTPGRGVCQDPSDGPHSVPSVWKSGAALSVSSHCDPALGAGVERPRMQLRALG